jgi:hypothetical protein
MIKKLLEYPRDNTQLDPFKHLLEIKTWGTKWNNIIDKADEWGNMAMGKCKNGQRDSFYNETNCEHFQE